MKFATFVQGHICILDMVRQLSLATDHQRLFVIVVYSRWVSASYHSRQISVALTKHEIHIYM